MKIKDGTGKEIEVFTQEELDEKLKKATEDATKTATDAATDAAKTAADEAIEKYKEENPDKSDEIKELKDKLTEAEEAATEAAGDEGEGKGNDGQVKRLKEVAEKAKKDLTEGIAEIKKEMTEFKQSFTDESKDKFLDTLSKGDKEVRDKIEFEFDNYRPNDTDGKAVGERMTKAFTLATGESEVPNFMDNMSTVPGPKGDGNNGDGTPAKGERSDNEKEIAKVMGVSEDDAKTFGEGGEKAPKDIERSNKKYD